MSKKHKYLMLSTIVLLSIALGAFAYASVRKSPTKQFTLPASGVHAVDRAEFRDDLPYVRRASLRPQLVRYLNELGDRLERPGKERLVIDGELYIGKQTKVPISMIREFPGRLRLNFGSSQELTIISSNGEVKSTLPNNSEESRLFKTLLYDCPEHFFLTQMKGFATRFLGSRFRLDDGSSDTYAGPYYDLYQVADQISYPNESHLQMKLFYFNSTTLLLERVSYESLQDGSRRTVEVLLGDWRREEGQFIPHRVERIDDGQTSFILTSKTRAITAKAKDDAFDIKETN